MKTRLLSAAALPVELFPGRSASACDSLSIAPAISCSLPGFPGGRAKNTCDLCAVICLALQIQSRPDDFGAIPHDPDTHAAAVLAGELKTRSIVLDGQLQPVLIRCQSYNDGAGFTMIDGVRQGFLHNVV